MVCFWKIQLSRHLHPYPSPTQILLLSLPLPSSLLFDETKHSTHYADISNQWNINSSIKQACHSAWHKPDTFSTATLRHVYKRPPIPSHPPTPPFPISLSHLLPPRHYTNTINTLLRYSCTFFFQLMSKVSLLKMNKSPLGTPGRIKPT